MNKSENINELAGALAKAQGTMGNPTKDSKNPHFNSKYADLATGLGVVRPALSANALAVTQTTRVAGDVLMLDTTLMHASGQWLSFEYPVTKLGVTQQQIGSALTYARRYSLFAIVGIAGEDDDGNDASKNLTPAPTRSPFINDEQVEQLDALLVELGEDVDRNFKRHYHLEFLSQLPTNDFGAALKILTKKKAMMNPAQLSGLLSSGRALSSTDMTISAGGDGDRGRPLEDIQMAAFGRIIP